MSNQDQNVINNKSIELLGICTRIIKDNAGQDDENPVKIPQRERKDTPKKTSTTQ